MSVPLSRRLSVLLVILISSVAFRCSMPATRGEGPPPDPKKFKPVITVTQDGVELKADPRVAVLWDVEPVNPQASMKWQAGEPWGDRLRSDRPVKIVWNGPYGLDVKFDQTGKDACVTPPRCSGTQCTANILPLDAKKNRACTYKMFAPQKTDEDADIVVTPCCW